MNELVSEQCAHNIFWKAEIFCVPTFLFKLSIRLVSVFIFIIMKKKKKFISLDFFVDAERIAVWGIGNGGQMAHRVICESNFINKIVAVTSVLSDKMIPNECASPETWAYGGTAVSFKKR